MQHQLAAPYHVKTCESRRAGGTPASAEKTLTKRIKAARRHSSSRATMLPSVLQWLAKPLTSMAEERDDPIARRPHAEHGRIQVNEITESGRALLARCKRAVRDVETTLLQGLTPRDEEVVRR